MHIHFLLCSYRSRRVAFSQQGATCHGCHNQLQSRSRILRTTHDTLLQWSFHSCWTNPNPWTGLSKGWWLLSSWDWTSAWTWSESLCWGLMASALQSHLPCAIWWDTVTNWATEHCASIEPCSPGWLQRTSYFRLAVCRFSNLLLVLYHTIVWQILKLLRV